jgi:hypothetical protein
VNRLWKGNVQQQGADDVDEEWETVGSARRKTEEEIVPTAPTPTPKPELSEEEKEKARQARRERRKREKEIKRSKREEEKRAEMMAPKTSKIKLISSDVLERVLRGEAVWPEQQGKKQRRKKKSEGEQGRHSPIFLQFVYLFSIFFLNRF